MMAETDSRPHMGRFILVSLFLALWGASIAVRLLQLQVFRHDDFVQLALRRQQKTREVLAPRGVIYDRHMDDLATSVTVKTVVAEPRRIEDIKGAASGLARILRLNSKDLSARMADPSKKTFQIIQRRIDPRDEALVEALGIDGVYLVEESMRVYPNRELASNTLGFVNMNGDGGAGLELQYDRELRGTQGLLSFDVDARHRSFRARVEQAPVQGHSLVTSLDRSIQYIAERELQEGIAKAKAAAGIAVVLESDTGRVLALANYPNFNSNTYNKYRPDTWRNRVVSDMYEPGSTFKVVVATAALEAKLTRPDEVIDCQNGAISIGGHAFRDHHPYGPLTFSQVLENSSNVGAAKLGLRLGEQRLHEALRTFGFGSRTQIDLPGEIVGLVRDWQNWSGLSIGAISFGQEVGVTPIQMLVAVNCIANGGYRVRPTLVDRVINHEGDLVRSRGAERTRIMKEETAAAVSDAFEGVILRGTGKSAALEGYRAAGKTGTAQKIENGRYSNTKYLASFIGFAPLPNPMVTVMVMIDEPMGSIYGGQVAAPVFQKITQEVLLQLRVPPAETAPRRFDPTMAAVESEDYLPNATPLLPSLAEAGEGQSAEPAAIRVLTPEAAVQVPDFRGMAKREVVLRCQEIGIQMQSAGSGVAVFQLPIPGTSVPRGEKVNVTFARGNLGRHRVVPGLNSVMAAKQAEQREGPGLIRP